MGGKLGPYPVSALIDLTSEQTGSNALSDPKKCSRDHVNDATRVRNYVPSSPSSTFGFEQVH